MASKKAGRGTGTQRPSSKTRSTNREMRTQPGNNQAFKGNAIREHRRQQAADWQQSSTSHHDSGQQTPGNSRQYKDDDSPSTKKRREGSRTGQAGQQPYRPQPSLPSVRLLKKREQQPGNTITSGQQYQSPPPSERWPEQEPKREGQIDDLQRQLQNLRDHYEKEKRQYEQESARMKRQIEDLQRQLKSQHDSRNSRDRHEVERTRLANDTMLENKRLQEEIEKLQWEIKNLKLKNQDLLTRISSMASERMRSNNPCVEDLSDPNRHSAVLARWQALMNGEFWTLYEVALKRLPSETHTAQFLLRIMELAFEEAEHLENGSAAFLDMMRNQRQAQDDPSMTALLDLLMRNEKFQEIVDSESRKVRKGGNATLPATAFQVLHKKIQKEYRNVTSDLLEKSHKFADEVLRLCFLMALQSPPMALVFDRPEGKEMDALLYEPDGDRNRRRPWIVNFVLTPPLLRYERGPVLLKGTVELQ